MAAGQEVALQQALAQVLGQHLHHPSFGVEPLVVLTDRQLPPPTGHLEHVLQAVARQLVGREQQEVVGVAARHLAQPAPEHPGGLVRRASRCRRPRRCGRASRGDRGRAAGCRRSRPGSRSCAGRPPGRSRDLGRRSALVVEELLRPVARIHASSTRRWSSSVRAAGSGTWCARKVPSTGCPSTTGGHPQPLGVRRTIIGHARRGRRARRARCFAMRRGTRRPRSPSAGARGPGRPRRRRAARSRSRGAT